MNSLKNSIISFVSIALLIGGCASTNSSVATGEKRPLVQEEKVLISIPDSVDSTMVIIPTGTLAASGSFDQIIITQAFLISKYESTGTDWDAVSAWAAANPEEGFTDLDVPASPSYPIQACGPTDPIYNVTWYNVLKYCNAKSVMEGLDPVYYVSGAVYKTGEFGACGSGKVTWDQTKNGYRVPTVLEWEYAARGGAKATIPNYTYSGSNTLNDVATNDANSGINPTCTLIGSKGTSPVGTRDSNELGLYDMSGNVMEWNWDARIAGPDQGCPEGTKAGRFFSGGNFKFGTLTVNSHGSFQPSQFGGYLGFRVVRSVFP